MNKCRRRLYAVLVINMDITRSNLVNYIYNIILQSVFCLHLNSIHQSRKVFQTGLHTDRITVYLGHSFPIQTQA